MAEAFLRDPVSGAGLELVTSLRTSCIGACVGSVSEGLKEGVRASRRTFLLPQVERRGYQVLGLNCPKRQKGLTDEQRMIRVMTYDEKAAPFLSESRQVMSNYKRYEALPCVHDSVIESPTLQAYRVTFAHDGAANPFSGCLMGLTGCQDLAVIDLVLDTRHVYTARSTVDKLFGTYKAPPSFYFGQIMSRVKVDLQKSAKRVHNKFSFGSDRSAQLYEDAVRLCYCGLVLDKLQLGTARATHFIEIGDTASENQLTPSDLDEADIIRAQECMDTVNRNIQLLRERFGTGGGAVPAVAATELEGTPYEETIVSVSPEQLDNLHRFFERDPEAPQAGICGPNITGQRPPIDTRHPDTVASAISRHFCKVDKKVHLPDDTVLDVFVDKSDITQEPLSEEKAQAWAEMTEKHCELFAEHFCELACQLDQKPHSFSDEDFAAMAAEVVWDDEWAMRNLMRSCLFCKKAEGGDRARFITMPGSNSSNAKKHQAHAAPLVSMIEKLHEKCFNHRNCKGATSEGKAVRVGHLLQTATKKHIVIGYDKSANDRTWKWADWMAFERYCHRMAEVYAKKAHGAWVYKGNFEANMEDESTRIKYFSDYVTLMVPITHYYLMSAVNPTALSNRLDSDASVLGATRRTYGKPGYETLFQWMHYPVSLGVPLLDSTQYFRCLERGVELLQGSEEIGSPVEMVTEGDDNTIKLTIPSEATPSEIVSLFTRELCAENECWVPAIVSGPELDSHYGNRSVVEMMSSTFAVCIKDELTQYAMCAMPFKKLDKLAWTQFGGFSYVDTDVGMAVVRDAVYHRVNATRCFSICLELADSLFVRWVVLRTGIYHLIEASKLTQDLRPIYGDRSMEGRGLEDAPGYLPDHLEIAANRLIQYYSLHQVTDAAEYANCSAWLLTAPQIVRKIPRPKLLEELWRLDSQASALDIGWDDLVEPESYVAQLDIKLLAPVFAAKSKRVAACIAAVDKGSQDVHQAVHKLKSVASQKSSEPGPSAASGAPTRGKGGSGPSASNPSDKRGVGRTPRR